MIRYTCDLCKRDLDPQNDLRYVVKIEMAAVFHIHVFRCFPRHGHGRQARSNHGGVGGCGFRPAKPVGVGVPITAGRIPEHRDIVVGVDPGQILTDSAAG